MSEHFNCGHAYRWMSQTRMGTRHCTWHATTVRMWWWTSWSSVARMWTRLTRRASHPCTSLLPHGTERSALSCSWEMELMSISRWDLYYGCTCVTKSPMNTIETWLFIFLQSKDGKTPLHMTAIHGRFSRSQAIIQNGESWVLKFFITDVQIRSIWQSLVCFVYV